MKGRLSPAVPESHAGVVFPMTDGKRSTQPVGRHIIATATRRVDTSASEAARGEEHWFRRYPQHFHEMTRLAAGLNAGLIATDGLAALHESMRFVHQGAEGPIMDAIDVPRAHYFTSVTIGGTGRFAGAGLTLHDNDTAVQGSQLDRLLDRWSDDGTAEPSAVEALRMLNERPELLDLRGQTFVLLGAGAEMGPYSALLSWGAHVVAVDLPGGAAWRGLIDIARQSPGRLTLPVRHPLGTDPTDAEVAAAAGADVLTEAPELTQWLLELDGPLTVGDYVYAPGATHVRVSTAVDAILATLVDRRGDVGLAYLATPTDVYAVPSEVVTASMDAYASSGRLVTVARGLGGRRVFRPNYPTMLTMVTERRFGVFDGLITQQGANYALAKRIQRWRATRSRENGTWVSINVAPPTRTRSVVDNRLLEAAYGGSHRFGLRVFTPAASRQVMAALLVHDLRHQQSVAHASVPLENEMDLFAAGAVHGGMWRAPYEPRSVLGFAAITGRFSPS